MSEDPVHQPDVPIPSPYSINEPVATPHDTGSGEAPVITALSPSECTIGDPDFTLEVTGENFSDASVIFFAGHDEPTLFDGVDTVTTGVKPSLWAEPVVVQCQVRNGDALSNQLEFTFNDPGASRSADPDDLEDEIDEAIDNDDIKPTHRSRPAPRKKR